MTAATNIVVSADAAAVSRVVGIQEETEEEAARRKKQRIGVKDGTGVDGVALGSPPGGAQGLTDEMLRKAVETVRMLQKSRYNAAEGLELEHGWGCNAMSLSLVEITRLDNENWSFRVPGLSLW
jgi:hypothetical protein